MEVHHGVVVRIGAPRCHQESWRCREPMHRATERRSGAVRWNERSAHLRSCSCRAIRWIRPFPRSGRARVTSDWPRPRQNGLIGPVSVVAHD